MWIIYLTWGVDLPHIEDEVNSHLQELTEDAGVG